MLVWLHSMALLHAAGGSFASVLTYAGDPVGSVSNDSNPFLPDNRLPGSMATG